MSWVRLHDGWNRHPKFAGLPRSARLLWLDLMSYARENLTDGLITKDTLPIAALDCPRNHLKRFVTLLLSRGLLDVCSGGNSSDGPWVLHDYLDWNDSRESVLKARAKTKARVSKYRESKKTGQDVTALHERYERGTNGDVTRHHDDHVTHAQPNPTQPIQKPPVVPHGGQPVLSLAQPPEPTPAPDTPKEPKPSGPSPVDRVFEYWREKHMPRAKKTQDRMRKLRARLKEGYSADELCRAVDGVFEDDFLMGHNDRDKEYRDIVTIFKSGAKVDELIGLAEQAEQREASKDEPEYPPDPPGTEYSGPPEGFFDEVRKIGRL